MAFLSELRRRKVFQVAIGYLAVAWLLVQVTATILPAFDLPVWALRLVVLLFALGFPIAVLMAWALELTPEGVKLDVSTSGGKRMLAITAALAVIALGWFFRGHLLPPRQHVALAATAGAASARMMAEERSIAVLPLVNASKDPEQQFFSDGLSENLIDTLSRFDGLKVIGRTSSFQLRDSKDDSATIGHKLDVSYLLSGSVQRAAGIVRISASLIKAADGSTLWAQHYDRPYKNLFALQDEIAQAVANALQVKLLSPEAAAEQDDRPPSGNIEAYNAYLQGLKVERDDGFGYKANQAFAKAVQLDPGYAAAWAHLSGTWTGLAQYWDDDPEAAREHLRKAGLAVDKALQLAPELGIAHVDRAWFLAAGGSDYREVLAECRRSVQLTPDSGMVLFGCSWLLARYGQLGEAIGLRERLLSVEPLVADNYPPHAEMLMAAGRLDEAEKLLSIADGLSRPSPYEHLVAAMLRGDANAAMRIATQASGDQRDLYIALAAQVEPDRAAADAALTTVLQDKALAAGGETPWRSRSYRIAQIYALRGDAGNAMQWLERTRAKPKRGSITLLRQQLLYDPFLLRLRDDPRFIAFCKKIGLPPPSESEALSIDQIRALPSNRQPRS